MSQTQHLFSAQAKANTFAAGTGAPTPKLLTNAGNTVRLVNTDTANGVYVAIGATPATAIATLPVDGSVVSCWVGPGADFTVSIPSDAPQYWSGIAVAGTPALLAYVGNGS